MQDVAATKYYKEAVEQMIGVRGVDANQWRELFPMLEAGRLDPVIGGVFALDDVARALRTTDERRAVGKVLVRIR